MRPSVAIAIGQTPGQCAYIIVTMRTWPFEADRLAGLPSDVVNELSSHAEADCGAARVPSARPRCWIGSQTVMMKTAATAASTDAIGSGYRSRALALILIMWTVPGCSGRRQDTGAIFHQNPYLSL